jgi:hypothetical protein
MTTTKIALPAAYIDDKKSDTNSQKPNTGVFIKLNNSTSPSYGSAHE